MIRDKIKEIVSNMDKFETTNYGSKCRYIFKYSKRKRLEDNYIEVSQKIEIRISRRFLYRKASVKYKDIVIFSLTRDEEIFLFKNFYKKAKQDVKNKQETDSRKENESLNSITFND